jgi:hypothetical protein
MIKVLKVRPVEKKERYYSLEELEGKIIGVIYSGKKRFTLNCEEEVKFIGGNLSDDKRCASIEVYVRDNRYLKQEKSFLNGLLKIK